MNSHQKHWTITSRIQSLHALNESTEHEIIIGLKTCIMDKKPYKTIDRVCLQVLKLDLQHSPILHPAFDGEMRSMIGYLVGAFPCIMVWSYETWEEYLRKDPYPEAEIDHWMAVDRSFTNNAGGKPLKFQMEVFRLLLLHCTPLAILNEVCDKNALLSDDDVDVILDDYYAYYVEG